jgi:hypothetical protein
VEAKKFSLEGLSVVYASSRNSVQEKILLHNPSGVESRRILGLDVEDSSSEEDFKVTDVGVERA